MKANMRGFKWTYIIALICLVVISLSSCSKNSNSNPDRILDLNLSNELKSADSIVIYIQDSKTGETIQTLYQGNSSWNQRDFTLNPNVPEKYEILVIGFDESGELIYFKLYNEKINLVADVYNTALQSNLIISPMDTVIFEGDSLVVRLDSLGPEPNFIFWYMEDTMVQVGSDSLVLKNIPRKWTGHKIQAKVASKLGIMESDLLHISVRGIPTDIPSSPIPEDGATDQPIILDLSWTTVPPGNSGVLVFDVYLDEKSPPLIKASSGQSDVKYMASNLKQNTVYYWRVVANQGGETAKSPIWSFKTRQSPLSNTSAPNIPADPSPSNNAEDQNPINLTLRWTGGDLNPLDLVKYDVHLSEENPPIAKVAQSLITNQFNINFLEHGKTYFWQITASDGMATSFGPVWKFTTSPPEADNQKPFIPNTPNPPDSATNQEISGLELFWKGGDPDGDQVVYNLFWGTTTPPNQNTVTGLSNTKYTLGSLLENTTYYWYVASSDGSAISIGPIWRFTTKQPDPNNAEPYTPKNPTPANGSENLAMNVKLSWEGGDPDGDGVKYDVLLDLENPPENTQNAIGIEKTSYDVSGLEPGKTYYWKVLSSDGNKRTEGPVWSFTTNSVDPTNPAPEKPQIDLPDDGATGVTIPVLLRWTCEDENKDTLTFNVLLGTSSSQISNIPGSVSQTTLVVDNLEEGTTYYWRVDASDGNQKTEGDVWSFTTKPPEEVNSPPNIPSDPSPSDLSDDIPLNLTLSWEGGDPNPDDIVTYDVYLDESPNPSTKKATVTQTNFTVVGLANGITYYWKIVASDGKVTSNSPVWRFTSKERTGPSGIFREFWDSLEGVPPSYLYLQGKEYLTNNSQYPDNPDNSGVIDEFESLPLFFSTFGIRYRGYIHPPSTGEYTFWVAANDYGELWLSTNTHPGNIGSDPISYTSYFTATRDWDAGSIKKSDPVYLVGGQEYYIEAFYIQGSGGTNFAVGWQGPGIDGNTERPIPGHRLSPWNGVFLSPPTITAQPQTAQIRAGQTATFTVEANSNSGTLKYQWRKNGILINGANEASYVTPPASYSDDSSSFDVIVSNDDGTITSNRANLILIYLEPVILGDIPDQTVYFGNNVTFTVSLAAGDNPDYTWLFNGSEVISAKDSTYTINSTGWGHNGGRIQVVVSNKAGIDSSNQITLHVRDYPPEIVSNPVPQSVREGDNLSFTVAAAGTNLKYQWFKNGVSIQENSEADSYSIANADVSDNGSKYYVMVYNSADSVYSDTVTLAVTPFENPPAITNQPQDTTVMAGSTASFAVSATGTQLNYQWFKNDISLDGETGPDLNLDNVQKSDSGSQISCQIWNTLDTIQSENALLHVIDTFPTIITQPFGSNIAVGESPGFTVVAQGSNLSYQWFKNNTAISQGGTQPSYNGPQATLADDSSLFFVSIANSTGNVNSDTVVLRVSDIPPDISNLTTPRNANSGSSLSFNPTTTGTNLSFQWYHSPSNNGSWANIDGATDSSYTTPQLNASYDGDGYRLIAINSAGMDTSNTVVIQIQ